MKPLPRQVVINPIHVSAMLGTRFVHDVKRKFTLCYDRNNVEIHVSIALTHKKDTYNRKDGRELSRTRYLTARDVPDGILDVPNYYFIITRENLIKDVLNHPTFLTFSNYFMSNILDFDMISSKLISGYVTEKAVEFIKKNHPYHRAINNV